jgi:hypothetical protein
VITEARTLPSAISTGVPHPGGQSARVRAHQLRRIDFEHRHRREGSAFFLLHANVDRLWAKWQRQFGRFDAAQAACTIASGEPGRPQPGRPMWPWNGITGGTRPPTAPGGALAASPSATAPGPQPRVRDGP